jgi:hypothetical protein
MALSVFPDLADDVEIEEKFSMKLFNPASLAILTLSTLSQTAGDFVDPTLSTEEVATPPTFNGKYEGNQFDAVVKINISMPIDENQAPIGTATVSNIELIDYSIDCDGFDAKRVNDTIEVSGRALNVFGQTYLFLMPDGSVKGLSSDTEEDFISIVSWSPPEIKVRTISHKFNVIVSYTETSAQLNNQNLTAVLTLTMPQTIRWDFSSGVQNFQQLLSRSRTL